MRDIHGAMYGSRLIDTPAGAAVAQSLRDAVDGPAPVLVEIGFDHGRRLSATARLNPDWQVVGIEVRKRRVDEAIARAEREGRSNLLAVRMDARTVFANVLPDDSVDVVEALFPDPWVKPAHRRRRLLVSDAFLGDVARVLKTGGLLLLATDVERYAEDMRACLARSAFASLPAEDARAQRPGCDQQSRREWRCEQDGTPVHWLAARF